MFGSHLVTIAVQMCFASDSVCLLTLRALQMFVLLLLLLLWYSVVNYDRKHLENSEIGLEFFSSKRVGTLIGVFKPSLHIIKTTVLILTKFCTVIKSTKCPSSKHAHHKSKMADGRHLGKMEKLPYLRNGTDPPMFRWCRLTFLTVLTIRFQTAHMRIEKWHGLS